MKFSELVRRLEDDGWYVSRKGKGSCRIYRHLNKPGQITVHYHPNKEVKSGTAIDTLKAAGLA